MRALAWARRWRNSPATACPTRPTRRREHFSEEEVVFLSVSIATINAWNRLGAAFRFAPPIPKKVAAAAA